LREEHTRRLRVFEKRMLRGKFGLQRDEVIGEWRKLHNEELCDFYWFTKYYLGYQIRRMRSEMHTEFWWGNLRKETTLKTEE